MTSIAILVGFDFQSRPILKLILTPIIGGIVMKKN